VIAVKPGLLHACQPVLRDGHDCDTRAQESFFVSRCSLRASVERDTWALTRHEVIAETVGVDCPDDRLNGVFGRTGIESFDIRLLADVKQHDLIWLTTRHQPRRRLVAPAGVSCMPC
jgi:hypothetical protein